MSDQDEKKYTNFDLELAEQKIIAAGGTPEYADALYSYFQGWRNYTMGQFGQQFVNAYEDALKRQVGPIQQSGESTERILGQVLQRLDQQVDLVQQILTAHRETARGVKKLQGQMRDSQADRKVLHKEINAVKDDIAALQARIDDIERRRRGNVESK
jgi:ribosomal 50S subunit-associated protein YjgA (DUF615 family)